MCEKPQGDSVANDTVIISVIISLLILITTTSVLLAILMWLRRRKREPELMDNAAYHSHNTEIKTDSITAHHTANDIETVTNEAYAATSVPTSLNPAYQPVAPPRESVDIATETNMAYVATDVATSVNPAYQPMQNSSDMCEQEKERIANSITTETNMAYVATSTDIATSVNPAYQPTQNSSDNTLEYDYI